MILSFGGKTPRDEGAVFVAANATVLGDVTLGKGTNIWYGAVLRGDEGTLVLEGMVIPDNSVAVGVPARVIKTIRDDQLAHNIENAEAYVEMGRQHAALVSDAEN